MVNGAANCHEGLNKLAKRFAGRSVLRREARDLIDGWIRAISTAPRPSNTAPLHELSAAIEAYADVYRYDLAPA